MNITTTVIDIILAACLGLMIYYILIMCNVSHQKALFFCALGGLIYGTLKNKLHELIAN